ncbi:MAG: helix-turn-helix transcriptional regulator [Acidimicrobiia bacterium]
MQTRTPAQLNEARFRAMADPVRRRILRVLEDSHEPRDIQSLAAAVHLHPNTVRGHLDVLEAAEFVTRSRQARQTPGRPRLLYERTPDSGDSMPGGYRLLAEMLTTTLRGASDDPGAGAHYVGREWGRNLARPSESARDLTAEETIDQITGLLRDLGFAPEPHFASNRTVIDLSDCPFRDLARHNTDIVCRLHLGMLEGAAEALGGAATVETLEPFVEPSLCRTAIRG